ncbi:MAG: membrane protein insertion efficiency factor YidD [Bdellovibrionaceae bacterium]|nr:membrane protein insertion efficiency factor YidD [Pseudobdellovibrionaceae bacterium]
MSALKITIDFSIGFYQVFLGPWLGGACRFTPSCSCYARQAFQNHGVLYATWLTIFRLIRCHPFSRWGYDPVPSKETRK